MYEIIKSFIGDLPSEFTFIYAILTLFFGFLIIKYFVSILMLPINIFKR